MKNTFNTLWIPLPSGKVARVRVDVLEVVLPSPLEVEQGRAADEDELSFILLQLDLREYQETPPFEVGLSPVSYHAQERGKKRAGLDKDALARTAAKALKSGLVASEAKGSLRRYLDHLGAEHHTTPRIHGNHVFIFGREDCLVTVLELPHEHRQAAASAFKKRDTHKA